MKWIKNPITFRFVFVAIGIGATIFVVLKYIHAPERFNIAEFVSQKTFLLVAIIQLFLIVANLMLEGLRWHCISYPITKYPFRKSFKQVLIAIPAGIVTPGRIGELISRSVQAPEGHKTSTLGLAMASSVLHTIIIGVLGMISFVATIPFSNELRFLSFESNKLLITIGVFIGIAIFITWILKKGFVYKSNVQLLTKGLKQIPLKSIIYLIGFTILRFICYNLQLAIWLALFTQIPTSEILTLTPIYYLIITIVPSFILLDLGIKGTAALLVFSSIGAATPAILIAIFMMWIFNTAAPTLLGSVIIFRQHLKSKNS